RSLIVLRALTHEQTGGIVAAPTTSLPETMGGGRNWDYRFVWLRDAALTLESLMLHGYGDEALGWRDWLLRAIAGDPEDVQIMYGINGERRLPEWEIGSLPGYEGSAPVRAGNGAYTQFQGDVFGEVMIALEDARELGIAEDTFSWSLQVKLLNWVETQLDRDDAAKLLQQVQKMVDAGLDGSVRIAGHTGDKQTDSLETYRQWLQEKGGLSVYA
ncbi:MAG: glycoside hydrolase family 15 protein, partial [Pseudomonas sp.]|nr:glycoside hydrolase family 15 protein [Pseudomonas sp.]